VHRAVVAGMKTDAPEQAVSAHVVLLTNFVPPYRLPLFEALGDRVARLTVLVSTPVEANRTWAPDSGKLDVRVQRTISLRRRWRHPSGFSDRTQVHLPLDTVAQLRRLRPDVVISAELGARSLLSAIYCSAARTPLILWATLSERTEHGRGLVRRALRRWLARRAQRVITNGASGERYLRSLGLPEARIDRIPYVALPEFAQARTGPDQREGLRDLLFVGQVTKRKGLAPFIETLDGWARAHPDRELTLTVVGSGQEAPAIEAFATASNLAVRMRAEQDPSALPAILAGADAFVFPTLADEWGVVVNEALATGLPVLGSVHSQAVEELCEEGVTGWVFDPEVAGSTAAAIDRAMQTSHEDLARMRELARARVRALTPDWAADRIVATIRATLAGRR
jgi:glycosyltransferase involved in cell wall biosynthesis